MRKIKFKAKHLKENVICDVKTLTNEGAFLIGVKKGENTYFDNGKSVVIHPENGRFCEFNEIELLEFTGFVDKNGNEIFEGDNLTDVVETDKGKINSKQKVFWNQPTGSWHLDNSFSQDETSSTDLWLELNDFKYEVITHN